ncbi:hypothetical protein M885DRAFT_489776 [Pelagophyceae sp. CCMP2097]|nr:hypothetical protein M885DRAFT_489776 [Pelagophyceae sp. CCMP2097]
MRRNSSAPPAMPPTINRTTLKDDEMSRSGATLLDDMSRSSAMLPRKDTDESTLPSIRTASESSAAGRRPKKGAPAAAAGKQLGGGRRTSVDDAPSKASSTPKRAAAARVAAAAAQPTPGALDEGAWENELARSILVLYSNATKRDEDVAGKDYAIDGDEVRAPMPDDPIAHQEAYRKPVAIPKNRLAAAARAQKAASPAADSAGAVAGGGLKKKVVAPLHSSKSKPIWFLGSGAVDARWTELPGGDDLAEELGALDEAGQFTAYVAAVERALNVYVRRVEEVEPGDLPIASRLWRQLALTVNAFGLRCVEQNRHAEALQLLQKAELLAACPALLGPEETRELRAFAASSHAYYYYRRGKCRAALAYATSAMRVHARQQAWPHVAKCHLHSAAVLSRLGRHGEAVRCLGQVLFLVESGRLDVGGAAPQKLCLVAVCYHNVAVEQMLLNHLAEAAVSAQNARRLARLCLSYSNRWLHNFEQTHKCATQLLNIQLTGSPDLEIQE